MLSASMANAILLLGPSKLSRSQNKYYEIPRNPTAVFTDRDRIYIPFQNACLPLMDSNIPPRQTRFVLYGLGGSGKTQLCLKFAEDHREKCVTPISAIQRVQNIH